jgi:hypothetical protein
LKNYQKKRTGPGSGFYDAYGISSNLPSGRQKGYKIQNKDIFGIDK